MLETYCLVSILIVACLLLAMSVAFMRGKP